MPTRKQYLEMAYKLRGDFVEQIKFDGNVNINPIAQTLKDIQESNETKPETNTDTKNTTEND